MSLLKLEVLANRVHSDTKEYRKDKLSNYSSQVSRTHRCDNDLDRLYRTYSVSHNSFARYRTSIRSIPKAIH